MSTSTRFPTLPAEQHEGVTSSHEERQTSIHDPNWRSLLEIFDNTSEFPARDWERNSDPTGNLAEPQRYQSLLQSFVDQPQGKSLYSGALYSPLSLLSERIRTSDNDQDNDLDDERNFIVAHAFDRDEAKWDRYTWCSPSSFDRGWDALPAQANKIVFLCGYPTKSWLCHVGSKLGLDYRFLRQHLPANPLGATSSRNFPPLSLIGDKTLQLTFTSMGKIKSARASADIHAVRQDLRENLASALQCQNDGHELFACDTIVRDAQLLDAKHFIFEHMISIKLIANADQSWTILAWTDNGTSLGSMKSKPWEAIRSDGEAKMNFLPLPRDFSNESIREIVRNMRQEVRTPVEDASWNPLASLPYDILFSIGPEKAAAEPLFVINEVLQLYAASEQQFLHVMENIITRKTDFGEVRSGISEVQMLKAMVNTRIQRLHDVLEILEDRIWRRDGTSVDHAWAAESASLTMIEKDLECTFRRLLRRAEAISEMCKDAIAAIGERVAMQLADCAAAQQRTLNSLTVLTYVVTPLSYVASLFGMNIKFNKMSENMWAWGVASGSLTGASLLTYFKVEKRKVVKMRRGVRSSWSKTKSWYRSKKALLPKCSETGNKEPTQCSGPEIEDRSWGFGSLKNACLFRRCRHPENDSEV